jgi:hypothetical protein
MSTIVYASAFAYAACVLSVAVAKGSVTNHYHHPKTAITSR